VNDNFVSIALKWVLQMVRKYNVVDFNVLRAKASTCRMTIFLTSPHEVKRIVCKIIKDWWCPFGLGEAKQVAYANLRKVSSNFLALYY
jgi:hypothetical protein